MVVEGFRLSLMFAFPPFFSSCCRLTAGRQLMARWPVCLLTPQDRHAPLTSQFFTASHFFQERQVHFVFQWSRILKHILVIGAVKQYFHSSNISQSHETFLDTQVLPVSVSVSQVYISAHCSRDHIIGLQLRRSSLLLQELDKDQLTTTVSASRRDGCTCLDLPRTTPLPAALY